MHQDLINQVESWTDPRYSNIKVVNFSGLNDRRGVCSLVFRAWDNIQNAPVALKFLDPLHLSNVYLLQAFAREADLLKSVSKKPRCLTMSEKNNKFDWQVNIGSVPNSFPIDYFTTEWLDEDVDQYFFEQQRHSSIEKLEIFRLIVLAIQAIHEERIFHRDIKADNIRKKNVQGTDVLVIIDYGLAARLDEPPAAGPYPLEGLGAPGYRAPESILGLCFVRDFARGTDFWALGALLYEMFNRGFLWDDLKKSNFSLILPAALNYLRPFPSYQERVDKLHDFLDLHGAVFSPPKISGRGSSVPSSISIELQKLFDSLCCFDYRSRQMNFDHIVRRVDICLSILRNRRKEARILEIKRERRENRIRKLEYRLRRQKEAQLPRK